MSGLHDTFLKLVLPNSVNCEVKFSLCHHLLRKWVM